MGGYGVGIYWRISLIPACIMPDSSRTTFLKPVKNPSCVDFSSTYRPACLKTKDTGQFEPTSFLAMTNNALIAVNYIIQRSMRDNENVAPEALWFFWWNQQDRIDHVLVSSFTICYSVYLRLSSCPPIESVGLMGYLGRIYVLLLKSRLGGGSKDPL